VLVLVLVVAFDLLAVRLGGESMTDAARRWFQHGFARWLVIGGIVFLAIHLTVLPNRYDPLHRTYQWFENRYGPNANYVNPPAENFPSGTD
jgi:hypothetical protein